LLRNLSQIAKVVAMQKVSVTATVVLLAHRAIQMLQNVLHLLAQTAQQVVQHDQHDQHDHTSLLLQRCPSVQLRSD